MFTMELIGKCLTTCKKRPNIWKICHTNINMFGHNCTCVTVLTAQISIVIATISREVKNKHELKEDLVDIQNVLVSNHLKWGRNYAADVKEL